MNQKLPALLLIVMAAALGFVTSRSAAQAGAPSTGMMRIEEEIPGETIKTTASSQFSPPQTPQNLVNGAGMDGLLHDNAGSAQTMWHTVENPPASRAAEGAPLSPAWVRFDFDKPHVVGTINIWNHNQAGYTDRGFQRAHLLGTTDGVHWEAVAANGQVVIAIPRASGSAQAPASLMLDTRKLAFQSVLIAADSNYGSTVYGLAAVRFYTRRDVAESDLPAPTAIECAVQPFYRHRTDGQAGREVTLHIKGAKLYSAAQVTVGYGDARESTAIPATASGTDSFRLLLPPGVGVAQAAQIKISLHYGHTNLEQAVTVPAKRQWTVYIYPHSHVDIGYTNLQSNVELIHKRNIIEGIALAEKTANYPPDARYHWNSEATWPMERYFQTATAAQKENVLDAIKKGYFRVDAAYANENTSLSSDEELFSYFKFSRAVAAETGVPCDTMVQVDVPGMTWGIVPVAAQQGVKYILSLFNGGDRTGLSRELSFRPFWWVGPDGKSKVLFLQPGDYTPGARAKGMPYAVAMMGQTKPNLLPPPIKTNQPRANFIDGYLFATLNALENSDYYPYDIFAMSWAMADNTPIDADLPDAVKSWNEDYAYPHLVIAGAHQIMDTFATKYGNKLPTYRGDFTEYWTDGAGTAAKQTGMNRGSKERLIQADTLWTMLHHGQPAPRADFDEAWRYVILGTEHTWCFADPGREPINNDILQVKFSYFQQAQQRSAALLAAALAPVAQTGGSHVAVLNTLSWPHDGLVTLSANQSKAGDGVTDEAGAVIPSQRLASGELVFRATTVPAFGSKIYKLGNSKSAAGSLLKGNTLDNGLVNITLSPETGDIVSLKDKTGYEWVDPSGLCAVNSYRYLHGGDSPETATGPTNVKIIAGENGPVVSSLLVESSAEGCTKLTREVRIIAGEEQVQITNIVDKVATRAKEGIHFGFAFNVPDSQTHVDIPWGVMRLDADQLPAANRNWIAFQRWLDISNTQRGITWCSLEAPTFESGTITANILGSAIGSPAWIRHLAPSATIYSWALNNHWHTNFPLSQGGQIPFRYRIGPHEGGYDAVAANRFGLEQAEPLIAVAARDNSDVKPVVAIDNPRVIVTILKTSDDGKGIILRLRSLSDQPESVNLTWPARAPKSIHLCVADDETAASVGGAMAVPPYGVLSLRIQFQ